MVVFSFASQNIDVIFHHLTRTWRNTARFAFKFLEFCFHYIFFFMLKAVKETKTNKNVNKFGYGIWPNTCQARCPPWKEMCRGGGYLGGGQTKDGREV